MFVRFGSTHRECDRLDGADVLIRGYELKRAA